MILPISFTTGLYFLIGFMGAGKSYFGQQWANENDMPFYDLDTLIEEEEKQTIEQIFATKGEHYFREKEAAILRNTEVFKNAIIACGGGTPCFFDNMSWMNKIGTTVLLKQSEDIIFKNLQNDKKVRPLLQNKTEQQLQLLLQQKIQERLPFYNQSKIILMPHHLI